MNWASWLEQQVRDGALRPLDFTLAEELSSLSAYPSGASDERDLLFLAVCLASRAIGEGSPCAVLESVDEALAELEAPYPAPSAERLTTVLEASGLCADTPDGRPLVLTDGRLYLQRYAGFECELAAQIVRRVRAGFDPIRVKLLHKDSTESLWSGAGAGEVNWQAVACAVASSTLFSVITGGPGTGKTYTVVRLLLTLLADARGRGREDLRVGLAAPTGKAAQRLAEALRAASGEAPPGSSLRRLLDDPWISRRMPDSASTLHRLLGWRPGSNRFRHDEDNPLELDALVVDECSMVDLALMTRLLRAMKPTARLVLVGDRHQLVSVEAGNVLPELCAAGSGFDESQREAIFEMTGERLPARDPAGVLAGHIVELRKGYRSASAVASLAAAINAGDGGGVRGVSRQFPGLITQRSVPRENMVEAVESACNKGWFSDLRKAASPHEALASLERFRVLAALNRGPFGIDVLNLQIEESLSRAYGFEVSGAYHLRPVLIVRNDYRLRLFNGDVGVIFKEGRGPARAWFPAAERDESGRVTAERRLISYPVSALPLFQTCYAMTVHKSQGSEFDHVSLILPDSDSPVVTRELIYTAVTRARHSVEIWSDRGVLQRAIEDYVIRRVSGLQEQMTQLQAGCRSGH